MAHHFLWGDYDPATKRMLGDYGHKYPGAVTEKDSLITEANGFTNISFVHQGSSFGVINTRERELKTTKHESNN